MTKPIVNGSDIRADGVFRFASDGQFDTIWSEWTEGAAA